MFVLACHGQSHDAALQASQAASVIWRRTFDSLSRSATSVGAGVSLYHIGEASHYVRLPGGPTSMAGPSRAASRASLASGLRNGARPPVNMECGTYGWLAPKCPCVKRPDRPSRPGGDACLGYADIAFSRRPSMADAPA